MRKIGFIIATLCLTFSSCSYNQFSAAATGSTLGGIFGSSIGGLVGGYHGHQMGTAIGMTAGAAIGLAATAEKSQKSTDYDEPEYCHVEYDEYEPVTYKSQKSSHNEFDALRIERIQFADANNNRYLDAGERASIELEIYNYGDYTLYNISPNIGCDNRRIMISPAAIVAKLEPGQGFRYRAEVSASSKLKDGEAVFYIYFGKNEKNGIHKSFRIQTRNN